MKKIPPSEQIRQEISSLLSNGTKGDANLLTELIRKSLQRVIQEALEQEVTDYLGRGHYERRPEELSHRGYRNGYEPKRVKTAEGPVGLRIPQLRDNPEPYHSELVSELKRLSPALEHLVQEMYVRGLSTRDIEEVFRTEAGEKLLSRTAVSELSDDLWEEYERFCQRKLDGFEVQYLFLDAVYESMRLERGKKEGILVAWGITTQGVRVLLHLTLGNKESYENWLEMLRDMVKRGLTTPLVVTSDGSPGLIRAMEEVWPKSLRQRCLVHKKRNILAKVPAEAIPEVKAHIDAVYHAPTFEGAKQMATQLIGKYQGIYPSAMKAFEEDLEACLNHLRCPVRHRKAIRTTNLLERTVEEERRRSKVIPRFFDEKSCLKLAFATLIRVSERWQRLGMNAFEKGQIRKLREELKLSSPVIDTRSKNGTRKAA